MKDIDSLCSCIIPYIGCVIFAHVVYYISLKVTTFTPLIKSLNELFTNLHNFATFVMGALNFIQASLGMLSKVNKMVKISLILATQM